MCIHLHCHPRLWHHMSTHKYTDSASKQSTCNSTNNLRAIFAMLKLFATWPLSQSPYRAFFAYITETVYAEAREVLHDIFLEIQNIYQGKRKIFTLLEDKMWSIPGWLNNLKILNKAHLGFIQLILVHGHSKWSVRSNFGPTTSADQPSRTQLSKLGHPEKLSIV